MSMNWMNEKKIFVHQSMKISKNFFTLICIIIIKLRVFKDTKKEEKISANKFSASANSQAFRIKYTIIFLQDIFIQ